jgi:hypothetical protein
MFNDLAYVRENDYTVSRIRRLQTQSQPSNSAVTARQTSSAPPAARVADVLAAAATGYTFSYYEVAGTYGYNIYRNTVNDPNSAVKIDFVQATIQSDFQRNRYTDVGLDPEISQDTRRTYTDNPGVTSYYWVAAVNSSGNEGTKIAMQGASVPTPGTGSGIQTLNSLTGATQTFAVGTAGTDFAIVSAGSTHTFNIPSASGANRGLVTNGVQTIGGPKTFSGSVLIGASTSSATGCITMKEVAAPGAPAADEVYIYAQDNGGGKTQLMALFSSGAAQQIALQP